MNPLVELDDYDGEPDIYQADGPEPLAGGGRDVLVGVLLAISVITFSLFFFVGAWTVGTWLSGLA